MAKQLTYSDEARQKLLAGVSKLARAVRSTLGPRGRNAVTGPYGAVGSSLDPPTRPTVGRSISRQCHSRRALVPLTAVMLRGGSVTLNAL